MRIFLFGVAMTLKVRIRVTHDSYSTVCECITTDLITCLKDLRKVHLDSTVELLSFEPHTSLYVDENENTERMAL